MHTDGHDTVFIGRSDDLARLGALLDDGQRLITVLGPGGMGKTRLARQVAGLSSLPACLTDISHATSADGICAAVADALGQTSIRTTGFEAVGQALAGRGPLLLVLDNLEQVTEAAAAAVAAWLAVAPRLSVLATSRERLGVRGEVVHELGPLGLPGDADASDGCEAVRLFVERARAARPDFVAEREADAVAAIVQRLDGIPLAIELAAARARVLSPRQLLARLESRFGLLRGTDRFAEPRQATLWGAIEWSWQLLATEERVAFCLLCVFPAGFDMDQAESMLGPSALDLVQALRDKSLLRASGSETLRFGFYDSVRAFGLVKLAEAGSQERAERSFLACVGDRVRSLAVDVHSKQGESARRLLAVECDNALAAIRLCLAGGDFTQAAELLLGMDSHLAARGPYDLHAALLDEVVIALDDLESVTAARILEARGAVHRTRGALDTAIAVFRRGLTAAPDGAPVRASLIANLGIALHERGRLEEASEHHSNALQLFEKLGDRRGQARALGSLAILQQEQGALGAAEASYGRAIAMFRAEGDLRSEGIFLINLGDLYKEQQLLPTARSHYEAGLQTAREIGDRRVEAVVLGNLGSVAQEEGRGEDARRLREEAIALLQLVGDRRLEGVFTGYLGTVHHAALDRERAAALYRDAVALLDGAGDARYLSIFLGHLGAAEAGLGRRAAALAAFSRGRDLLDGLGDELLLVAHTLHEGHLELAQGATDAVRARMDAALGKGHQTGGDLAATPAGRSDEVRFAIALLELALDEMGGEDEPRAEEMGGTDDALVVSADGRSFRPPGGETVHLGRRKAPRLILLELVRRRLEGEGGLGVYDLMDVGWPGEILHPESGSNRVYVAITTLRNLGLREVLVHRDDGYTLDPAVAVVEGG